MMSAFIRCVIYFIFIMFFFNDLSFANVVDNEIKESVEEPEVQSDESAGGSSIFDILFGKGDVEVGDEASGVLSEDIGVSTIESESGVLDRKVAVVHVIDKTLGKLYKLNIPVGSKDQVNELTLKVKACIAPNYPTIIPEGRAQLEIFEARGRHGDKIFQGWLYAQSRSVSHIAHPKYEVLLYACE